MTEAKTGIFAHGTTRAEGRGSAGSTLGLVALSGISAGTQRIFDILLQLFLFIESYFVFLI
jgi:hypothetical protein